MDKHAAAVYRNNLINRTHTRNRRTLRFSEHSDSKHTIRLYSEQPSSSTNFLPALRTAAVGYESTRTSSLYLLRVEGPRNRCARRDSLQLHNTTAAVSYEWHVHIIPQVSIRDTNTTGRCRTRIIDRHHSPRNAYS